MQTISDVEKDPGRGVEFGKPLKAPSRWEHLVCALYSRGVDLGPRGSKAFEAISAYNGKVIERRQLLENVRSELSRLGLAEDVRTADNTAGQLTSGNFWQSMDTLAKHGISAETNQSKVETSKPSVHSREAKGPAISQEKITDFLLSNAAPSRQGDLIFRENFVQACKQAHPKEFESGSLSQQQLDDVLRALNEADLG